MSVWIIPVQMEAAEIQVEAEKSEVFRKLTSFATNRGSIGPKVLVREETGTLLVEFRTAVTGLLGRRKTHRTVERVTLNEPDQILFKGVEGPLDLLIDRISLIAAAGRTRVRYESTIGLKGSVFGWLICRLYVRRVLSKFMQKHLSQLRDSLERDD